MITMRMKKLFAAALLTASVASGQVFADEIDTYPNVLSPAERPEYPITDGGADRTHPMLYRMDDVYGNSGSRGQWAMIVRSHDIYSDTRGGTEEGFDRYETRGGKMSTLNMIAGANIVNERNNVFLYNGFYEPRERPIYSPNFADPAKNNPAVMPIKQIFMVIPDNQASGTVDFYRRPDLDNDSTHPGSNPQPWTLDVNVGDDGYVTIKDSKGQFTTNPQGNRYTFDFIKEKDADKYSTIRTYLTFHQNPSESPSQTINIPLIIANVAMGSAAEKPLEFNTVIRENSGVANNSGQLIASHHFTWDVTRDKTIESNVGDDWIFVPQNNANRPDDDLDRTYTITVDVKNYSGLRYALQRYDLMGNTYTAGRVVDPESWRFDLPLSVTTEPLPITGTTIEPTIKLDNLSHIAPGLITRYIERFNIRSLSQRLMSIYPADTVSDNSSPRDLILTHNRVGGVVLGQNYNIGETISGRRHTDVRAFYYLNRDPNFLTSQEAKTTLHLYKQGSVVAADAVAAMPDPSRYKAGGIDIAGGVSTSDAFVTDAAVGTAKFDVQIPDGLRYVSDDASLKQVTVLPVIITFNVPANDPYMTRDDIWGKMLEKWRTDANVKDLFKQYFTIYSHLDDDAVINNDTHRNFNISNFLEQRNAFNDSVKVMIDEENSCMTVTFMAMLVDSAIADYGILEDALDVTRAEAGSRAAGTRKFISILDGHRNDRWDLTMYVRRVNIGGTTDGNANGGGNVSSSSGGGCATGLGFAMGVSVLWLFVRRKDR